MDRIARTLAVLALAAALGGCLTTSHRIPRGELMALSTLGPEERGERVRVIQSLAGDDPPAPAPHAGADVHVFVAAPIWIGGTPHHHGYRPGPAGGPGVPAGGSGLAAAKKSDAKNILVVAAVVAGVLVFTEGIRFDGWARLHPMQPVHLWGPGGEYTWMPLAHVTPDVAAWADHAVVRSEEGPWQPLERAPLDRVGFTYSLLLGGSQIALIGDEPRAGFGSHLQLGFFPRQDLGVQLDLGYGWTDDAGGATVFDGRAGLELTVLPLGAGRLHAGGFGEIGISSRSDDGIQFDDSDGFIAGGLLAQLELTTRLALTLRPGITRVHDESLAELTFGVSIY
jgi:hypothetical protein